MACRGLALNYKGNSLEDEKAPKCQLSEVHLYFSLSEMIETSFYASESVTSFTVFNSAFPKPKMETTLINTELPVSDLPETDFKKLHFMLQSKQ